MPKPVNNALLDSISFIRKGMNSGIAPRLLAQDQLAFAINVTCRGGLPKTRPVWHRVPIRYHDPTTHAYFAHGLFQGGGFYQSYGNNESCLLASVSGKLFRILVGTTNQVEQLTVSGAQNSSIQPQVWMYQAEDFLIINDGQSYPLFFDGAGLRRSKGPGGNELPAGCMGCYVQGRVWQVNPDRRSFIGGDLVYSHGYSGPYSGRDAVLQTQENTLISGGGAFSVPITAGDINAMSAVAICDTSLGQGSLQVLTANSVFSVSVPLERTDWVNTSYPWMTIGLPNYGALSAWSTVPVNGDIWYRSRDGIRSYQLARRDFSQQWVNTPLSVEVERVLNQDSAGLLGSSSGVLFDNRYLLTCSPHTVNGRGVAHRGLIALDFNNVSTLLDRSAPMYDGLWTGIEILQILKGTFNGIERCFAFALECGDDVGLYELLPDGQGYFDYNGTSFIPIKSSIESRAMSSAGNGNQLLRLVCGDLYLDKLGGTPQVVFDFKFRSDEDPIWVDWHDFNLCAALQDCSTTGCPTFQQVREQYRTYLRLPEPTDECSQITKRRKRTGYEFQIRMAWTGYAQLNRLHVWMAPDPDSVVKGCPTSETCTLLTGCDLPLFDYSLLNCPEEEGGESGPEYPTDDYYYYEQYPDYGSEDIPTDDGGNPMEDPRNWPLYNGVPEGYTGEFASGYGIQWINALPSQDITLQQANFWTDLIWNEFYQWPSKPDSWQDVRFYWEPVDSYNNNVGDLEAKRLTGNPVPGSPDEPPMINLNSWWRLVLIYKV